MMPETVCLWYFCLLYALMILARICIMEVQTIRAGTLPEFVAVEPELILIGQYEDAAFQIPLPFRQ